MSLSSDGCVGSYTKFISMVKAFDDFKVELAAVILVQGDRVDQELIRSHLDYHTFNKNQGLDDLYETACGTANIDQVEFILLEFNKRVMSANTLLENHDLIVGMTANATTVIVYAVEVIGLDTVDW
eukprot:CAMPEP_0114597252 /NCGR_PEP_ID=MMETSP0125-20121206/19495_1 /TAXON_ID=485358 ORGANISM="Aristerostoma sp., Strain ATCC 50986" /NCGR_SAMPLE_ID=MMETSP0125 /ASSEMBLY_ACC=CAM_ASM_000245 /LENGTH=125 /DNA_ID=CAMNT_0001801543 /DNA_START=806 /DNA_END=1180 /DNA_ORIENTATION=-